MAGSSTSASKADSAGVQLLLLADNMNVDRGRRTCDICGLTYARSDTLKRHRLLHTKGVSSRVRPRACQECARSKLKCDGQQPVCKRCADRNHTCQYTPSRDRSMRPGSDSPARPDSSSVDAALWHKEPAQRNQTTLANSTAGSTLSHLPAPEIQLASSSPLPPPSAPSVDGGLPDWLMNPGASQPVATYPPVSLYSIFPDSSLAEPTSTGFAPSHAQNAGVSSLPGATSHLDTSSFSGFPLSGQNAESMDINSLFIDPTGTFWSGWETLASPTQSIGRAASSQTVDETIPVTKDSSLGKHSSSLGEPNQAAGSARTTSTHSSTLQTTRLHGSPTNRPSPSPAFFENDRLGQSMSNWNTFYDAARDDGDVLRGHQQIFLTDDDLSGDLTVERLKARWKSLKRFTFDHRSKSNLIEAVIFSGISHSEQRAVYRTLARLEDTVYLHFFSLFLHHVHFRYCFLHLPTLNPSVDSGLLSLAIISVGAFYSDMPNARQFAIIMLEIVRRGCERVMTAQPKLSRDVQTIQALILSTFSRAGGEGREMETYERYRSLYCTTVRRMMGFHSLTMPVPPSEADGTEEIVWQAWIRWEQLKRTALFCFFTEIDAAATFQLGITISIYELELNLPCPEAMWEATDAHDWLQLYRPPTPAASIPLRSLLGEIGHSIDVHKDETLQSPYAALVTLVILLAASQSLLDLEYLTPRALANNLLELDALQSRLSAHNDLLHPWFNEHLSGPLAREFFPALLTYHLCPILRHVRPNQMLAIAGRGIPEWNVKAREQLSAMIGSSPRTARQLALHAGQILWITRQEPYQGPEEGLAAYLSVVYLYIFIGVAQFDKWQGLVAPPIMLDNPKIDQADAWLTLGYAPSLEGIGLVTAPGAAARLLSIFGKILSRRIWSNDRFLGKLLLDLAEKEQQA